jgi:translocation and assembly module TamB
LAILVWIAAVLVGLAVLVVAAVIVLDTAPGRRLVASRLAGLDMNGLHLQVAAIDGSLYGRMTLRDVTARDQAGVVATSPAVVLAWRPLALLHRQVLVDELSANLIDLKRQPILKPSKGPSRMPSLSYTVRRLQIGSLVLEPALTGERRAVSILASADLSHGRTRLDAHAVAREMAGAAGGDVAIVHLDAEPKANRLQIAAHVFGPKGGVLDRLLKLRAPVALDLAGGGDWRDWRGRAQAAVGGESVLDAALSARNGHFGAIGRARPGRVVPSIAKLTEPDMQFDVAGSVQGQRVEVQGKASSRQFAVQLSGAVDRKQQILQGVRVDASLLEPSALSRDLSGRDVRLMLRLDGPFARPLVDYDLTARSLGYGKIIVQELAAHGRSARAADGTVQIPVSLTAARFSGLSPSAGPLTNVSLQGPVVIRRNGQVSADLALRSTRLSASLTLRGSQRTASYAGALTLRADAEAVQQFGLGGVLGGPASLSADFASNRQVTLQVSSFRLDAPLLRITQAQAAYYADGRISLTAQAISPKYGPLALTVGGTRNAIRAHLSAPNPQLPVPVTRLEADIAPAAAGAYRLAVTGASPYGPLIVDAVVRITGGPLTLVLNRAQLGDVVAAGTVARSAAGPFTGALTLTGDGLHGTLQLTAQGAIQVAQLDLRAANASLPLNHPLLIRSGRIDGRAVLDPAGLAISANAVLADVQQGTLTLSSVRARGNYAQGVGRVTLAFAGESSVSFQMAADAKITPSAISIDGNGTVESVRLRLAAPAQIVREGPAWRLQPATILTSGGRMVLAGTYGAGASVSAELQNINLGLIRAVRPDLGVSGRVSGRANLDLPQGGEPSGRLSLQILRLSHTGATTVSAPIDVNLLASLTGAGGDASANIREAGAIVGRLQVQMTMPTSGSFTQRLQAARVQGGLRYQGPADSLVSLTGISGQELTGPVAIGADVSGSLEHPQLRGVVLGRNLDYQNAKYGTHITGVNLDGRFNGARLELTSFTGATAGDGRVEASGYAELSAANGWPIDLTIRLRDAQLAQSDQLGARLSGTLRITNARQTGGVVSGDLTVDTARYQLTHRATIDTAELSGVHWKGQRVSTPEQAANRAPPSRWRLDVRVRAPNRITVNGMGLDSEWRADLHIVGDTSRPLIVGDVRTVRGYYSFGGRRLTLDDTSVIHFNGANPPDPTLDLKASATVNSVTVTLNVGGTATHPEIRFTSSPTLPDDEVLSLLLFGGSTAQLSPLQALQLAASLNALRGGAGGLGALDKLSRATGLENLRLQTTNAQTGQGGVGVGAGRYITSNIYVDVLVDAHGATATQIEIALTRTLSLLSQISTFGNTSGSVRYTHRY